MTFKLSLIASTVLVLSISALEVPTMTEKEATKQLTELDRKAKEATEEKQIEAKIKNDENAEVMVDKTVESENEKLLSKVNQTLKDIDAPHNEDRPYIPKKDINSSEFPHIMPIAVEEAPKEHDDDHDGVLNDKDKCPTTPEGVKVDADGCCLDDDHDGVCNYKDKCPGTPEGRIVDENGCQIDEDKDGILDYDDQCPHTPQMFEVDSKGCPITAVLKVNFDTNKYNIKDKYTEDIARFSEFLKQNPGYDAVVAGHTDSIGSYESNQILSQNRAKSVKDALVADGIDANRLTTVGYGEKRPIASNMYKDGRAQNRRIEVELKPKVNPTPEAPKASESSNTPESSDASSEISVDNFN